MAIVGDLLKTLDQMVNEPAELLVAGRRIARGEVVVVDGKYGLHVTLVVDAVSTSSGNPC